MLPCATADVAHDETFRILREFWSTARTTRATAAVKAIVLFRSTSIWRYGDVKVLSTLHRRHSRVDVSHSIPLHSRHLFRKRQPNSASSRASRSSPHCKRHVLSALSMLSTGLRRRLPMSITQVPRRRFDARWSGPVANGVSRLGGIYLLPSLRAFYRRARP